MNFEQACKAVREGRAHAHHLWILLSAESDRDGYAPKPAVWEGPGEYQRVSTTADSLGFLVRLPGAVHIK